MAVQRAARLLSEEVGKHCAEPGGVGKDGLSLPIGFGTKALSAASRGHPSGIGVAMDPCGGNRMNRKWLFAGALSAVIVLGVSSPAMADEYCVRSDSRQNVYLDRYSSYGSEGYGYTRPYDSYDRAYAYEGNYDTRYAGPGYGYYPETHSRYSRPYYQD